MVPSEMQLTKHLVEFLQCSVAWLPQIQFTLDVLLTSVASDERFSMDVAFL